MPEDRQTEEEVRWPSVDLAYEFVKPSYELLMGRVDAANGRMHVNTDIFRHSSDSSTSLRENPIP